MKKLNLIGQKFDRLTVIEAADKVKRCVMWKCLCDCGNFKDVSTDMLRRGVTKSCGCKKRKDLLNQKFGKLIVTKFNSVDKNQQCLWECLCECGNKLVTLGTSLTSGCTTSCGCNKSQFRENLIGKRFTRLLVVGEAVKINNSYKWTCLCDCGKITLVTTGRLNFGTSKSCGCLTREINSKLCSARKGILNPVWKGGLTKEHNLARCSTLYKRWRFKILKRDNYQCIICSNNILLELNSHHIINFTNKKFRHDLNNGTTLCKKCHTNFHKVYGKFNNNLTQIKEFCLFHERKIPDYLNHDN